MLHFTTTTEETIAETLNNVAEEVLANIRRSQGLDEEAETEAATTDATRSRRDSWEEDLEDKEDMLGDQPRRLKMPKSRKLINHFAVQRLKGIHADFRVCDGAHHISSVMNVAGITVGVCIPSGGRPITIIEISPSDHNFQIREEIKLVKDPKMAAIFEHGNQLHVVIADSGLESMRLYKLDTTLKMLEETNSVPVRFPTAVVVWQLNSQYHLAASESSPFKGLDKPMRYQTQFYSLKKLYFDFYASVDSFHVKDICPFSVGGKDYVVIINYESSPGNFQVDSEVFRHNANDMTWESVQRFRTTGAVDCEIFSMGVEPRTEIFLAVANSRDRMEPAKGRLDVQFKYDVESVIYKFSNERFVPFQCLKTVAATQIKAIDGDQAEGVFALAVAHLYGVQMFQYNGWRFVANTVQYTRGSMGPGVQSLFFTKQIGSNPVLIVANPTKPQEKNVINFQFELNNVVSNWRRKSLEWCNQARSVNVQQGLQNLEINLSLNKSVFFIDQKDPIRIKGDLTFDAPLVQVQGFLSAPSIFNVEDNTVFDHTAPFQLEAVYRLLLEVEAQAAKTEDILKRALRLDIPHQVVTGQYSFNNDLVFKCGNGIGSRDFCNFRDIRTKTLNGKDITNLANEVIRIDKNQEIKRSDLFFKNIEISGNLRVPDGLVNGVNMSQVVTKSGTHSINAPTTLKGGVNTHAISVSGLINGAKIDSNSILLKSGDQDVRSQLIFTDLTTNNLNATVINQVHFNDFLSKIVTTDGNHVILGKKDFKGKVDIQGNLDLVPGTTLSGVNIIDLWNNILWTRGDQEIRAPSIKFSNVKIAGDLNVESKLINGVSVPGDNMIRNDPSKPVVVESPKNFLAPVVKIDHMHVKKSINGIRTLEMIEGLAHLASEWPEQLDILIKSRSQTIPAHKTFRNSLHLGQHSTVEGTVSDIDLSELRQIVLKHNETNELSGTWTFNGATLFNEKLTVHGLVDGVNLTHLYVNSMKLTDSVITSQTSFNFAHIVADRVEANTVNDLIIQKDLMTKTTKQVITGAKIFPQGIVITGDFLTKTLNGIDIRFLNDSLLKPINQTVFAPKTIDGDLYVQNLVTTSLNGINMNDLILINTDQPQIITGNKVFRSVKISGSSLNVSNLEVSNDINGVKVKELFDNTMLYDAAQNVSGAKHFEKITIPLTADLYAESVNGYRFRDIIQDAVYLDGDQDIHGDKIFKSPRVHFKELNFQKTFDGVSEDSIKKNWLLKGVNQVIEGDLIFKDIRSSGSRRTPLVVVMGNLYIDNGTLNGHDIRALDHSIVRKNQNAVIEGVITFKDVVTSQGDVDVSGKIQGVKLATDALLKNQLLTSGVVPVFGKKTFKKNVIVDKNLRVDGHVDGVLVDELCHTAVRVFGDQVITAPVSVKGSVSSPALNTDGLIDGVDIKQLEKGCLLRDFSGRQEVQGKKHFKSLVLMAPSEVRGLFGGVDLRSFAENYMSLTKHQVIHTPIVFKDGITFETDTFVYGDIQTKDNLIRLPKANTAVDLKFIDSNSLKIYGNQEIKVPITFMDDIVFSKNVELASMKVNGIPFDWMMLKNRPRREVMTPVTFQSDMNIQSDLEMADGASVAGVDMSRIRRSMVDSFGGPFKVMGRTNFSEFSVDHLIVKGLLNGISFSANNILLSTPNVSQVIRGKTTFGQDVAVSGSLRTRTINGVDLHSVRSNLVLNGLSGGNTISAPKTFDGSVQARDTWTINLIDGVNVTQVKDTVYDMRFDQEMQSISNRLGFQERKLAKLQRVLDTQVDCVDHYRLSASMNGTILPSDSLVAEKYLFVTTASPDGCSVIDMHRLIPGKMAHFIFRIEGVFKPKKVIVMKGKLVIPSQHAVSKEVFKSCLPSSLRAFAADVSGKAIVQFVTLTNMTKTSLTVSHVFPLKTTTIVTDAMLVVSPSSEQTCLTISGVPRLQVACFNNNSLASVVEKEVTSVGNGVVISICSAFNRPEGSTIIALTYFSHVNFFYWNPNQKSLESSPQQMVTIQVPDPKTFPVTHMTPSSESKLFFILSEKKARKIRDRSPLIRVFQHQTIGVQAPFLENQQISETNDILAIDSLVSLTGDLTLFFLTDDQRIKIYRLKGASGFMLSDSIEGQSLFSSSSIASFAVVPSTPETTGHFVVVSASRTSEDDDRESLLISSHSNQVEPETKVLFSVVQNRFIPGLN